MGVTVREKIKGSGVWWVFVHHKGYKTSRTVGKDKRFALALAEKINAKLVLGDLRIFQEKVIGVKTFKEYSEQFIAITVSATCKPTTIKDYQGLLKNHILPDLGMMPVDQITRHSVKTFLMKKLNSGFADSTVNHMKNVVSGVLNLAVDDEAIPVNPAFNVGKIFKKRDKKPQNEPYSIDELAKFLRIIKADYPDHYPIFRTFAGTGMRFGEVLGLKWTDIDFENRYIKLQRSRSKGVEGTPKNSMGRNIDIDLDLTRLLKEFHHQRKIQTINNGWKSVPEYVFTKKDGTPYHESYIRRLFYKALEKGGLRQIKIHDLRHTYATLRITKGDNIADVSSQLGHHSISFTTSTYYHWKPGSNKSQIDELGTLVSDKIVNQE